MIISIVKIEWRILNQELRFRHLIADMRRQTREILVNLIIIARN